MLRLRKVDVAQLPLPIVFNLSYVNATAVVMPTGQPDVKKVGHFMIRTEPVTEIPLQFYAFDLRFRIACSCCKAAVAPQPHLFWQSLLCVTSAPVIQVQLVVEGALGLAGEHSDAVAALTPTRYPICSS
eukprot:COSAG01_NODE_2471_length_7630_cov_3.056566_8_plen_129_part_00